MHIQVQSLQASFSCIRSGVPARSELLSSIAPEPEICGLLQEIFGTFVWAFRQLQDVNSPCFKRSLQILVIVAQACSTSFWMLCKGYPYCKLQICAC